jgi:hypothetical protein
MDIHSLSSYKLDGLEATFTDIVFRERGRDPWPSFFSASRPGRNCFARGARMVLDGYSKNWSAIAFVLAQDGPSDPNHTDIVALVRLHVRLYVLSRHQSHFMPLRSQSPPQKMRSVARFHADPLHLQIRGEIQQLRARTPLLYDDLPALIQAHEMKYGLTQIDPQRQEFHEMPPCPALCNFQSPAADRPINWRFGLSASKSPSSIGRPIGSRQAVYGSAFVASRNGSSSARMPLGRTACQD